MLGTLLLRTRAAWLATGLLAACSTPPLERYTYSQPQMGTEFRIVLYAEDRARADRAATAAFQRIAELDASLSDWRPDSELNRLCTRSDRAAPTSPVRVSEDLWKVLAACHQWSERTDGAFDATVGPLTRLWRRAIRQSEPPDEEALAAALRSVDWRSVELDAAARSVRLTRRFTRLDLGGIAKGYALDEALRALARHGVDRALVDGGGDVAAALAPPGAEGWRVFVPEADHPQGGVRLLLASGAAATSGDAARFLEFEGRRYSHIVDPRTGWGLTSRVQVTVLAPSGLEADVLASAASVLGPEKGLRLLLETPDAEGRLSAGSDAGDAVRETPGFRARLVKVEAELPQPRKSQP